MLGRQMNASLQEIALRRMRKRISQYLERQRIRHPEGFTLTHIPLMSVVDRIWLIVTAMLLLLTLYLLRDFWWAFPLLALPAGFFIWKGIAGFHLTVPNDCGASMTGNHDLRVSDSDLVSKLTEIAATREASFFAINILLAVFLAVLEVAAAIIGTMAAVLGALAGG